MVGLHAHGLGSREVTHASDEHDAGEPSWQRGADAYYDLRGQIQVLRRKTLYVPSMAALLPGALGIALHVRGLWSVLGTFVGPDGEYYYVHGVSVGLAFVVPATPFVLAGFLVYKILRARAVGAFRKSAAAKYRISQEALDERIAEL